MHVVIESQSYDEWSKMTSPSETKQLQCYYYTILAESVMGTIVVKKFN